MKIESAEFYEQIIYLIKRALRKVNGRPLRRREKRMQSDVQKELNEQAKFLVKKLKNIYPVKNYDKKNFSEDVDNLLDSVDQTELFNALEKHSELSLVFGAQYRIEKMRLAEVGISFDLRNPLAEAYLKTDRPLIWANMPETTKEHIKPLLLEAVEKGQSYTETAAQISENFAYSSVRSEMIAVNEIGHAYEEGNKIPMLDLQEEGFKVYKEWLTAGDDRVTDECQDYEDMGRIGIDDQFISGAGTEDDQAPRDSNPRCRCTTLWDYE